MNKSKYKTRIKFPSRTWDKLLRMTGFIMELPATFKILEKKRSSATVQKYLKELLSYGIIMKEENLYRFNETKLTNVVSILGSKPNRRDRIFLMLYFNLPMKFKRTIRSKTVNREEIIIKTLSEALLESAKEGGEVYDWERVV